MATEPGTPILGRDEELQAMRLFLAGVVDGPAVLLLEGEAGIGKTTLHLALLEEAGSLGCRVLSSRPAEAERSMPFVALTDLFQEVVDAVASDLPAPQARALRVAVLRADESGSPPSPRTLLQAVASAIGLLAKQGSLVIGLDDCQWADSASLDALAFAARRLEGSVGIALARRTEPGRPAGAPPLGVDRAVAPERFHRIELHGLSLAAIHRLIRDRIEVSLPRPLLLRIHEITEGNPLFALELARTIERDDVHLAIQALDHGTPTLRELIERRTAGLSPLTREALLVASAAARPTVRSVSSALGTDARDWLVEAEQASLVTTRGGELVFTHPLLSGAAYSSAPAEQRRQAHERLARVVQDQDERARHMALAADAPDATVAALLDEAAVHARSRGAREAGAEMAEEARRLTPPEDVDELRRRTIEAAKHQLAVGDLRRARDLLAEILAERPTESLRAQALLLQSEVAYHEDSFPEALELLREVLKHAGDDPALVAPASLQLAFVLNAFGDFAAAEGPARTAVEQAKLLDTPGLLAEALAVATIIRFLHGGGLDREAIDRALALEDPDRWSIPLMRPSLLAGYLELYEGNLDAARARLGGLRQRLIDRGEDTELPFTSSILAWVECWRGDLDSADRYAREAIDTAAQLGSESVYGLGLAFGGLVAAHRGDPALARSSANEALEIFKRTGWAVGALWAGWALGMLELSLGDPAAAQRALRPPAEYVAATGLAEPICVMCLPEAMEALVGVGELELAKRLLVIWEGCSRRLDRPWALAAAGRCRALLLATMGEPDAALEAVDGALRQHERTPMPIEVGRTLLVQGQIERRLKRRKAANETLQRALDLFENHGARLWAERAREELRMVKPHRTASLDLTPTEARVAEAAAAGKTNREIADALFMSAKTVEANLSRVYRKLGIRSRAELGAVMARKHGETPD